jgi:hypothetical protein
MEIREFLKKWEIGEGCIRIINDKGNVIYETYNLYGGLSFDWINA